jgi:hypothetical protein
MSTTEFDQVGYARAVAAYGLAGVEAAPPSPVPSEEWRGALLHLVAERLTGLAVAGAEDGWLQLTGDQFEELLTHHRRAMPWCLGLEIRLLQIADAFDADDIPFLVLKGPALAHAVYANPSWRPFSDLDVLVPTIDWRRACALLQERFGWPRRQPEPRPGFDERFGKSAVFRTDGRQEIDLHRTLAQGPFGQWIRAEDLFEGAMQLDVAGRRVSRPDAAGLFVHACIHAVLGDATSPLLSLRDVAETAADPEIDWDAVRELVGRWRVRSVARMALSRASTELGWAVAHEASTAVTGLADRTAERALQAYVGNRRSRGAVEMATIRSLPGFVRKLIYARDLLVPQRAFLRSRADEDGASYVRRWRTPFRWIVPKRVTR